MYVQGYGIILCIGLIMAGMLYDRAARVEHTYHDQTYLVHVFPSVAYPSATLAQWAGMLIGKPPTRQNKCSLHNAFLCAEDT